MLLAHRRLAAQHGIDVSGLWDDERWRRVMSFDLRLSNLSSPAVDLYAGSVFLPDLLIVNYVIHDDDITAVCSYRASKVPFPLSAFARRLEMELGALR